VELEQTKECVEFLKEIGMVAEIGVRASELAEALNKLCKIALNTFPVPAFFNIPDGDLTSYVPRFAIPNSHFDKTIRIIAYRPIDCFYRFVLFHRRCFMRLKTFVNIRFER